MSRGWRGDSQMEKIGVSTAGRAMFTFIGGWGEGGRLDGADGKGGVCFCAVQILDVRLPQRSREWGGWGCLSLKCAGAPGRPRATRLRFLGVEFSLLSSPFPFPSVHVRRSSERESGNVLTCTVTPLRSPSAHCSFPSLLIILRFRGSCERETPESRSRREPCLCVLDSLPRFPRGLFPSTSHHSQRCYPPRVRAVLLKSYPFILSGLVNVFVILDRFLVHCFAFLKALYL